MVDSSARQVEQCNELPAPDGLAAVADAQRTVWRHAHIDFQWDIAKALEFALLRTYAVPSISSLLARTGEFVDRTAKRYDDTALLIREVMRNGLDSERAQRSFARINAMHGRFRIANDDYLYVLSTFVFTPIDWMAELGRRPLTQAEQRDWFIYWNEFGRRMGIQSLFADIDSFRAFAENFERTRFELAPSNRQVAERTIDLVLSMYFVPRFAYPVGRKAALALAVCEPHLVRALGFVEPSPALRGFVAFAMRTRRAILTLLPPNDRPKWQAVGEATYPKGYTIEELGTFAPKKTEA